MTEAVEDLGGTLGGVQVLRGYGGEEGGTRDIETLVSANLSFLVVKDLP